MEEFKEEVLKLLSVDSSGAIFVTGIELFFGVIIVPRIHFNVALLRDLTGLSVHLLQVGHHLRQGERSISSLCLLTEGSLHVAFGHLANIVNYLFLLGLLIQSGYILDDRLAQELIVERLQFGVLDFAVLVSITHLEEFVVHGLLVLANSSPLTKADLRLRPKMGAASEDLLFIQVTLFHVLL